MTAAPVCFLDVETTGLSAALHEVWEVGLIVDDAEYRWLLPVTLQNADPIALSIGRFHERHPQGNNPPLKIQAVTSLDVFAGQFVRLTHGRHLVGAVVSFDEQRLGDLLRAHGFSPSWHYHLVDVEALVAGLRGIEPPWNSEALSTEIGVNFKEFDRHTALGDCEWARAMYYRVMGGTQ